MGRKCVELGFGCITWFLESGRWGWCVVRGQLFGFGLAEAKGVCNRMRVSGLL